MKYSRCEYEIKMWVHFYCVIIYKIYHNFFRRKKFHLPIVQISFRKKFHFADKAKFHCLDCRATAYAYTRGDGAGKISRKREETRLFAKSRVSCKVKPRHSGVVR
jgi:hypothetical protein